MMIIDQCTAALKPAQGFCHSNKEVVCLCVDGRKSLQKDVQVWTHPNRSDDLIWTMV